MQVAGRAGQSAGMWGRPASQPTRQPASHPLYTCAHQTNQVHPYMSDMHTTDSAHPRGTAGPPSTPPCHGRQQRMPAEKTEPPAINPTWQPSSHQHGNRQVAALGNCGRPRQQHPAEHKTCRAVPTSTSNPLCPLPAAPHLRWPCCPPELLCLLRLDALAGLGCSLERLQPPLIAHCLLLLLLRGRGAALLCAHHKQPSTHCRDGRLQEWGSQLCA